MGVKQTNEQKKKEKASTTLRVDGTALALAS